MQHNEAGAHCTQQAASKQHIQYSPEGSSAGKRKCGGLREKWRKADRSRQTPNIVVSAAARLPLHMLQSLYVLSLSFLLSLSLAVWRLGLLPLK